MHRTKLGTGILGNMVVEIVETFKKSEVLIKSSYALSLRLLSAVMGYLFMIVATRAYGTEAWGLFSLSQTLIAMASLLAGLGMHQALTKHIGACSDEQGKGVVKFFLFKGFIVGVLGSVVVVLLGGYFSSSLRRAFFSETLSTFGVFILLLFTFPAALRDIAGGALQGLRKTSSWIFLTGPLTYLVALPCLGLAFFTAASNKIWVPTGAYGIGIVVGCVFGIFILTKDLKGVSSTGNLKTSTLIATGGGMILASSFSMLMGYIDTLSIGYFLTEKDVGLYNGALRFAAASSYALSAAWGILLPKISYHYHNGDFLSFKEFLRRAKWLTFGLSMPVVLLVFLLRNHLLSLLGAEFFEANTSLQLLLGSQLFNSFIGISSGIFLMAGSERAFSVILAIGAGLNLFLNFLFIPSMGISGAALATLLSSITAGVLGVLYLYKKYKIWTIVGLDS